MHAIHKLCTLSLFFLLSSSSWARAQGTVAVLEGELHPLGTGSHQRFGRSVAIEGDRALVATDVEDVYAFERQGGTWSAGTLLDVRGEVVAIDGDRALVGKPRDDSLGSNVGLAFRLEYGPAGWTQTHVLVPPVTAPEGYFGWSVALEGERIAVGAHGSGDVNLNGRVFYSEGSSGVWSAVETLEAPVPNGRDRFGLSIALDGDRMLVGAPGTFSTDAHVFTRAGSTWTLEQSLPSPVVGNDQFGHDVDLEGDRLVIGAHEYDNLASSGIWEGAVFVFEWSGTDWLQTALLEPADAAPTDRFGWAVDLQGQRLLVGAYAAGDLSIGGGAGYLFEASSGAWTQVLKEVQPAPPDQAANVGFAVALQDDTLLLGARGANSVNFLAGAVYAYRLVDAPLGSVYCSASSACPCAGGAGPGGCVNSTGQRGTLRAAGSLHLADEFLTFRAEGLPPSQSTLLAVAPAPLVPGLPFGNGLRCIGGTGVVRLGLRLSNLSGAASWHAEALMGSGWLPGETRYLQTWYRDPQAAATCIDVYNTTDALELTLLP